jgi:hypothetical protein
MKIVNYLIGSVLKVPFLIGHLTHTARSKEEFFDGLPRERFLAALHAEGIPMIN